MILNDVTPLTLGTDIRIIEDLNWFVKFWRNPTSEVIMDPIIRRNSNIPTSETIEYKTTENN